MPRARPIRSVRGSSGREHHDRSPRGPRRSPAAHRVSRTINEVGSPSAASMAAASWNASPVRRAWTRRSRTATWRVRLVGWTRATRARSGRAGRSRLRTPGRSSIPSRSRRARAETHSTAVAHHTTTSGSRAYASSVPAAGGLGHEQRNDRRAVPEPHRPSRRSAMSASTALAPSGQPRARRTQHGRSAERPRPMRSAAGSRSSRSESTVASPRGSRRARAERRAGRDP